MLSVLCLALAGGALAAFLAAASRKNPDRAVPAYANLIEAILCVSVPNGAPAGFYTEMASAHERMHQAMDDIRRTGDPDRDFARSMMPHHQGAIDMALVQLKYGRNEQLRRLAQTMIAEQGQEIAYLKTILDQPSATAHPDRVARQ